MKKSAFFFASFFLAGIILAGCQQNSNPVDNSSASRNSLNKGGFDQFGYNYGARLFNGKADGVDKILDGKLWGDPTYANDKLVMKWTSEWDRGNAEGWANPPYTGAWEDNEWNGKVNGGSGAVWHYKIIWVGSDLENSPYWKAGGYAIWEQLEVIMDQGIDPSYGPAHLWFTHAKPNGYGSN